LTPKGQHEVRAISEVVLRQDAEMIKALDVAEQRQLKTLLDKIILSRAST